jgi:hypothetical protein
VLMVASRKKAYLQVARILVIAFYLSTRAQQ